MKKLILTITMVLTIFFSISYIVKAESTDLYNDSVQNVSLDHGQVIELQDNSIYQLKILKIDENNSFSNFNQGLSQDTFQIHIYTDEDLFHMSGNSNVWLDFTDYTQTFVTSIDDQINIELSSTESGIYSEVETAFDIQLFWIGYNDVDVIAPSFNYSELTLEVPYYDIPSLSEVQAMLTAVDDVDGDITSSIQLVSENISQFQVGDDLEEMYSSTFSVEDSSGNISYLTVNYDIYDDIFARYLIETPYHSDEIIVRFDEFIFEYGDYYAEKSFDINVSNLILQIDYTDFEDLRQKIENVLTELNGYSYNISNPYIDFDNTEKYSFNNIQALSESLANEIYFPDSEDNFTIGDYYYIDDDYTSKYELTFYFNILYIDETPPSFDGSATNISIDSNYELSDKDLMDLLVVTDETDSSEDIIITKISDTYSSNKNTLGSYTVIFSATDSSENTSFHTININVIDVTPPLYVVDERFIVVSINDPINQQDLDDILIAHGIVTEDLSFTVTVLSEDYFDNSTEVGLYTMILRIDYEDDTFEIIELSLETIEQPVPEEPIFNFDNLTNIQKLLGLTLSTGLLVAVALLIFRKKR